MRKEDELTRKLTELMKETKAGHIHWKIKCQTTEYNSPQQKPIVREDDTEWMVDECYVSYYCEYKGTEFLMITYEMIHSSSNKQKTTNLVFLPPLGIRWFDIHTLLPYAVQTTQILIYHVHMLWLTLLEEAKKHPELIEIDADERVLTIDEE